VGGQDLVYIGVSLFLMVLLYKLRSLIGYCLEDIFPYGQVDVGFLLCGCAMRVPPRGVGCGLHCHHRLGGACGVGRFPVETMCVVRMHIVWFVVPIGFTRI
jgi:hypothetical protein